MKISRELKVGIISLLVIILFIWGYNFLKNRSIYDSTRTFYAEYSNVQGLLAGSAITINGFKVGKISKITFHPNKQGILVVHLNLSNDIEFSKNSIAQIYSADFISGKSLKIKMSIDEDEFAIAGDTLKGEIDSGIIGMINEQIGPLQAKVESFVVSTDSIMRNFNEILDAENQKNIKSSLHDLSITLHNFNNISKNIDHLLRDNQNKIDSIFNNADLAMKNFNMIMDSLQKADLGATVIKLQTTLDGFNNVLDSIQTGHGTLGMLITDDAVYKNLEGTTRELEELLREIKLHPKRFVHISMFGKKEKPYQEEIKE